MRQQALWLLLCCSVSLRAVLTVLEVALEDSCLPTRWMQEGRRGLHPRFLLREAHQCLRVLLHEAHELVPFSLLLSNFLHVKLFLGDFGLFELAVFADYQVGSR